MLNENSKIINYSRIKKLNPNAILPTKGSPLAAGYDLYACIDSTKLILPHSTVKIGTGLAIIPPNGYFGGIFPRSGLSVNKGLRLANCVGAIDPDYRGEIIVAIHNDWEKARIIAPGDRIAQLIFLPFAEDVFFTEVETLDDTERGTGGFGSTGK